MASVHKEVLVNVEPEVAWNAACDWGALHRRLVPGFATDTRLEDADRIVTFFNGSVLRERLVDRSEERRRLVWTVVEGPYLHHNGSLQVFEDGEGGARIVWIADVLPHEHAERLAPLMEQGLSVIKATLERVEALSDAG
jgi:hypothetical protein